MTHPVSAQWNFSRSGQHSLVRRAAIACHRAKVDRALAALSDDLGESAWCQGNGISLADVAVGCALGYLDFRFPDIDWRERHANLAKLQEKLIQRPSLAETAPFE